MKKKAVLIIHGFAGGTYDLEELATSLELSGRFNVFTFTLPGHNGKRKEATKKNWLAESERQLQRLITNGYKKIYLVGHSMGGVIASYLASRYNNVEKLVLLAPAFRYFAYEDGILSKIKESKEAFQAYDKDARLTFMTKLPLNAFNEFIKLVKENQDTIKKIKIPTLIIQGTTDKIVPPTTGKYLYDNIGTNKKNLIMVSAIGHEVINNYKNKEVIKVIEQFLDKFSFMIKEEEKEI